jgi:hypothetical protein
VSTVKECSTNICENNPNCENVNNAIIIFDVSGIMITINIKVIMSACVTVILGAVKRHVPVWKAACITNVHV